MSNRAIAVIVIWATTTLAAPRGLAAEPATAGADVAPLVGQWAVTLVEADGTTWEGTVTIEKSETGSEYSCGFRLQRGGGHMKTLYSQARFFPSTRRVWCSVLGESSSATTAVLAPDGRRLVTGEWTSWQTLEGEDGKLHLTLLKTDRWTATLAAEGTAPERPSGGAAREAASSPRGADVPKRALVELDPRTLQVKPDGVSGGRVTATTASGQEETLFRHAVKRDEATRASAILGFYGVNEVLRVQMPGLVDAVYLRSGQVPAGSYGGEECTTFDPATLAVAEVEGSYRQDGRDVVYTQWRIADVAGRPTSSSRMVLAYNARAHADEMVSVLKEYGVTHRCRAGGFWYFRR